jgi:hypothetical protein
VSLPSGSAERLRALVSAEVVRQLDGQAWPTTSAVHDRIQVRGPTLGAASTGASEEEVARAVARAVVRAIHGTEG